MEYWRKKKLMTATISHLLTLQTRQINFYYPKGPISVGVIIYQVSKRMEFVALKQSIRSMVPQIAIIIFQAY